MITTQAIPAKFALPLVLAVVLGASCGFLPEREPVTTYQPVRTATIADPQWPTVAWSLLVSRPVAGMQIDSERINVEPAPGTVQVYKSAAWTDAAPDLLQMALLRGFEESQKILSVSRSGGGVRGQYQLLTELRGFQSMYTQPGKPEAVVEIYARLVHTNDGRVIAARSFRHAEPAAGEDVGAVVEAFSRALDRSTADIVGWTLRSGNAAPAESGKP
ncbi:MAG: ABC-type transport auxiliary lipoprotein family protein [Gammaproteobacteria bacterium]|nr:ABC-type transport auxiliary lipoprotein family protein [Gammaproteobacteria bacterium]